MLIYAGFINLQEEEMTGMAKKLSAQIFSKRGFQMADGPVSQITGEEKIIA